jgi:hypothetical protein
LRIVEATNYNATMRHGISSAREELMRHVVRFLPFVMRGLAICAVLAGVGAGLIGVFGAGFGCFDTCPTHAAYFARLGPAAVWGLAPCVVLEVLAVAIFLLYCLATRQARRAVIALLVLLRGGLVGVAVLGALALHARATLPIWGGDEGDLLVEAPFESWANLWAWALTLVAGAWSGVLAYLQWRC